MPDDEAAIENDARALRALVEPLRPGSGQAVPDERPVPKLRAFWKAMPHYPFFDFFVAKRTKWDDPARARRLVAKIGVAPSLLPSRFLVVGPPVLKPARDRIVICNVSDDALPLMVIARQSTVGRETEVRPSVNHYPSFLQYLAHSTVHWLAWHHLCYRFEVEFDDEPPAPLAFPALSRVCRRLAPDLWLLPEQGELDSFGPPRWIVVSRSFEALVLWFGTRSGWRIPWSLAPSTGCQVTLRIAIDDPRLEGLARIAYAYRRRETPSEVVHRLGRLGDAFVWLTWSSSDPDKLSGRIAFDDLALLNAWLASNGLEPAP